MESLNKLTTRRAHKKDSESVIYKIRRLFPSVTTHVYRKGQAREDVAKATDAANWQERRPLPR